MSQTSFRILLVADTHLGFDLPFQPRVERRRRGHDFFDNFNLALSPALRGEIDLLVHAGDLFYRSRVPPALVEMAMSPLVEVADCGVPVFLVPGNHERARIPLYLWSVHPNLYIFDKPRTFSVKIGDTRLALSGFPFDRQVRGRFSELVRGTGWENNDADVRLLCIHQAVEGAQVGPADFTFRSGADVVRGWDIPSGFTAVLAGHIHRSQRLTHDLNGVRLAAPVFYPGSIERTSFAERFEEKGYIILTVNVNPPHPVVEKFSFVRLPARPMSSLEINTGVIPMERLVDYLRSELLKMDPDSVVSIRLVGGNVEIALAELNAAVLRRISPPTMNVTLAVQRKT